MGDVIKTNAGLGSPGYLTSKAPNGDQWLKGIPPKQAMVPEGTKVLKTGLKNDYQPAYFCQIKVLDGPYAGEVVWVKNTHVVSDSPTPSTKPVVTYRIISQLKDSTGEYVQMQEV